MSENQNNVNEEVVEQDVNQLMKVRREKLEKLQAEGRNPFEITKFNKTHTSKQIIDNYEELEGKDVTVAGRIMAKRIMGKASFCHIQDGEGKIQSYVSTNLSSSDGNLTKTSCNGGVCYGDALSETLSYYQDDAHMIHPGWPWFVRGGQNDNVFPSGIFSFRNFWGYGYGQISTRSVWVPL